MEQIAVAYSSNWWLAPAPALTTSSSNVALSDPPGDRVEKIKSRSIPALDTLAQAGRWFDVI